MKPDTLLTLLAMAGVTWACRAGGLLLGSRLPREGPVARGLAWLPGCVLAALVAPTVAQGGVAEGAAALATVAAMRLSGSLPAAMAAGVLTIALLRAGLG